MDPASNSTRESAETHSSLAPRAESQPPAIPASLPPLHPDGRPAPPHHPRQENPWPQVHTQFRPSRLSPARESPRHSIGYEGLFLVTDTPARRRTPTTTEVEEDISQ